jgi:large subunit ribosomal protein L23
MKTTIVKPVITEKATQMSKRKVYSFVVGAEVTKHMVRRSIESLYKVKVNGVRVSLRKGKEKRVGKRMKTITMPDTKIAYVTLKEGEIDIFPKV